MNCDYATAAFTVSPESRALSCCDWNWTRRSLSLVLLFSVRAAIALALRLPFGRSLTVPPLPLPLYYLLVINVTIRIHKQGTSTICSRPCRALALSLLGDQQQQGVPRLCLRWPSVAVVTRFSASTMNIFDIVGKSAYKKSYDTLLGRRPVTSKMPF